MDTVTLRLPRDYVGQMLDGLDVLIEQWEATEQYMEGNDCIEDVIIYEAKDAAEAASIAKYYRRIKRRIEKQLECCET